VSDPALKLGPKGVVRWRAVSADSRVSPSFKIWTNGHDAYVAQRSLKDLKVSLHKDGNAHAGFTHHETAEAWTGKAGSKWLSDWTAPAASIPGWQELFAVIHPEPELRTLNEEGIDNVKGLVQPLVPDGMATGMHLFRSEPVVQPRRVTFADAIHVATFDSGDIEFHLMALLHTWGEEQREWASKARLAEPGGGEHSLAQPGGVNPASPTARLLKLVTTTEGGKWYVDLAGHPPEGSVSAAS